MKLSILALSAVVAGASASLAETRANRRLNKEFLAAMNSKQVKTASRRNRAQKIRALHENLIQSSRKLQDYNYNQGEAYADMGEWNGQYWEFQEEVPFDMSSRSFKYAGCAAIKSYDTERAEENGNPMVMDIYSVFRLCPSDSCNDYSSTGCSKNYGEYAVDMKTYLQYILNFYDERFEEYCEYCEPCDYDYEATKTNALQSCYQDMTDAAYQEASQKQQEAYDNYYNANNGDMSGWNAQDFSEYNAYYNAANDYNGGGRKLEQGGYYDENGNYVQAEYANGDDAQANQYNAGDANAGYYAQYNAYAGQYGGDNAAQYENGDGGYWANGVYYEGEGQQAYKCSDGTSCDYCHYKVDQAYDPCDDYVCGDYVDYCTDYYGERQADFDVSEFLECQPFENEYGNEYYIGPHCGSDHHTISLGVFSDENCVDYIGESVSIQSVLGFNFDDEDIFKLPTECFSCDAFDLEEEEEAQQNHNEGRYGDYVTSPATDENGVLAVCRALYAGSAQCNLHMDNYQQISQYMSAYELDLEKRYCTFVENIIYGSYDESGEIILQPETFDFSDWKNPMQYKKLKMPAGQAVLLSLSLIAFVAMAAAAIYTHRSMTRSSTPWLPKRPINMNAEDLARENSGIGMARSRSGPGAAPLI